MCQVDRAVPWRKAWFFERHTELRRLRHIDDPVDNCGFRTTGLQSRRQFCAFSWVTPNRRKTSEQINIEVTFNSTEAVHPFAYLMQLANEHSVRLQFDVIRR